MSRKHPVILIVCCVGLVVCIASLAQQLRYNKEEYCCHHMARDIEDVLEGFNIPVIIVRGENSEAGHVWVKVYGREIDSITLFPIEPDKYSEGRMEFDDYQDYSDWVKAGRNN